MVMDKTPQFFLLYISFLYCMYRVFFSLFTSASTFAFATQTPLDVDLAQQLLHTHTHTHISFHSLCKLHISHNYI